MIISMGPFISCFLASAFLSLYLYIILYYKKSIFKYNIKLIFLGIFLILIRMILPINFPFVYTIYSTKILPLLADIVYKNIGFMNLMISDILFMFWIIIALIRLIRLIIRSIGMKTNISLFIGGDFKKLDLVINLLKVHNVSHIQIAIIPKFRSPAITGLFHPILILPSNLSLTDFELEYIVLHEIEHYKHHDLWLKLLLEIIVCIHWWNPLIYLVKKEFDLAMEISNDILIIKNSPNFNTLDYANCILKIAKTQYYSKLPTDRLALDFVSHNQSNLKTRICFILEKEDRPKINSLIFHTPLIFIVILFSFLFVFDPKHLTVPTNVTETSDSITSKNTYIIKTKNGFRFYVNGKYWGTSRELPEDFKNYNLYQEGDSINDN